MSGRLYLVHDPEQDAHLRNQVVQWCESSNGRWEVVDWTPICHYGAAEQRMAQAIIRSCRAVVVLVGRDTGNSPNVEIEIEIARTVRAPIFQLISPEATRPFLPGAGPAFGWSRDAFLGQLECL